MTIGITRRDHTAEQLRAEAARCREGRVARRLLALALVLEGLPRWKAAEMCGMDRHVWTAPGVQGGLAQEWLRVACAHVSGLLTRLHDRWPRWDPQASAKQPGGLIGHRY